MTTTELLAALVQEYPRGVSFDPMAVRLLRQKVPFEDWQIEDLKSEMFQRGDGLWVSCEMILDNKSRLAFQGQAVEWLKEHNCFSVEQLLGEFCNVLHDISTPEDCAAFLGHLGFTVAAWGKGCLFCFHPSTSLDESLAAISQAIAGWLEEGNGTLPFLDIEQTMSHLSVEALENIRVKLQPEVHAAEVGGVSCWCSTEAIHLPEDFSEKLTTAVDTLVELDKKVSAANLEFALNLFYRIRFREEYALLGNDTFMRVCEKHYQGGIDFPNMKKTRVRPKNSSAPGKRVRRPNTRFDNLNVPVGARLSFANDNLVTCTVLDGVNQVEHDGKRWSISTLAVHLMGGVTVNGFSYFSYEGEMLRNRRLRLEQEGHQKK